MTIADCRRSIVDLQRRQHRHVATSPPRHILRAFTLIEMTVVIAIIILLAGLVLPAATQLWRDRKITDAQNMITGMLTTARARAIQSGGAETGLFFFIDDQGVQRVAPITQNPNDSAQTDQSKIVKGWESDGRWYNVFTVVRDRSFTLPSPMRVVPLYAICPENGGVGMCSVDQDASRRFSDVELPNSDFAAFAPGTTNVAQAHRNYFSLVFSPNAEIVVRRNVIIRDLDDEADNEAKEDGKGVVVGAKVKGRKNALVSQYYSAETTTASDLVPAGTALTASTEPTWLLVDNAGVAMNFPSVDGLLVYDDSLFNEAGDATAKRQFLKDHGLPFYINRITGAVVRGPAGETP